jgi:hypothetical protein
MDTNNVKVGDNYSVEHEAMVTKPDGTKASAKEILCAELPAAILAIEAGQALTKNPFLKFIFGMVSSALQMLGASFCGQ